MKETVKSLSNHNLPTEEFRKGKSLLCLNENPYGCSDRVKKVLMENIKYNEYPDDNCADLINKIADFYNIKSNNIMIGNGSGEILQILSRSILNEGDEVITCVPTYPYYLVETVVENAGFVEVPIKEDRFDIDGILNAITDKTKIIYITNPNNPIGTIITESEANKLIEGVRKDILIVFDEAYYEYVTTKEFPNTIEKIKSHENVCVLRTFSKAYGLAAMRVGYLIGSEELIDNLNKVRLTFNIAKFSQLAATIAIEDQNFISKCRQENTMQKERLYKLLDTLNISYIPSQTNFVVIEDAENLITEALNKNNIIVKTFKYKDKNHIRLSIGDSNIMLEVEETIKRHISVNGGI